MIVVMEPDATEEQIQNVIKVLNDYGFDVHRSTGVSRTVLGAIGVKPEFDHRNMQLLPGVAEVYRITEPYKLANRAFKHEGTVIELNGVRIGSNIEEVVVMAGPCAVESEEQIFTIAKFVAEQGVKVLRGAHLSQELHPIRSRDLVNKGLNC
jgi:3-deoxy-7-phosphoheptulonate synthase